LAFELGVHHLEAAKDTRTEEHEILQQLVSQDPDRFLPELALCSRHLGSTLLMLGRCQDAVTSLLEAAEIHRRLAATQVDKYQDVLDQSLHILAVALRASGRPSEAVAAAKEAVENRQRITGGEPCEDLAENLEELSWTLAAAGDFKESLITIQDAVAIRRRLLAGQQNDSSLEALASSIFSQSWILAFSGRSTAFKTLGEAAMYYLKHSGVPPIGMLPGCLVVVALITAHVLARSLQDAVRAAATGNAQEVLATCLGRDRTDRWLGAVLAWRPQDSLENMCRPARSHWIPRLTIP
jgi:tetratricopeptide (TPR) repeat protein